MKSVGVVIPCFNEEEGIPHLEGQLKTLVEKARDRYQLSWIFVDDGSTDSTYRLLTELSQRLPNSQVAKHERNMNLGAALRTGNAIAARGNDYVAYLDSDCTYDPQILMPMLARLDAGADLVTASPYHPEGEVVGVPEWRLFLSKGLSLMYRLITGLRLHTYTAMVRAIRAPHVHPTESKRSDFTYTTEVILNASRLGLKVEETPAVLKTRIFGVSKMKTLRTIRKHIELIGEYLFRPKDKIARENR